MDHKKKSGESGPQITDQIRPFPGEAAIGVRGAAEMAIGGGAGIDRLVEAEMLADAARAQVDQLLQRLDSRFSSTSPVP